MEHLARHPLRPPDRIRQELHFTAGISTQMQAERPSRRGGDIADSFAVALANVEHDDVERMVIDHVERHNVRVIFWRRRLVTEHARCRRRQRDSSQADAERATPGAICVRPECEHVVDVR